MIVGITGFIGSGKSTAANYLSEKYGLKQESFASNLKDAVSCIFGIDRNLLEGVVDRELRELPDEYWSQKLGNPTSPRFLLQYIGTDLFRGWKPDIWVWSLEKKLGPNSVIADVRWKNEAEMIKRKKGIIIRIDPRVDPDPSTIHYSEKEVLEITPDYVIRNDGTVNELYKKLDFFIQSQI